MKRRQTSSHDPSPTPQSAEEKLLVERIRNLGTQEARARRLAWQQPQHDTRDALETYADELRVEVAHLERRLIANPDSTLPHQASPRQMSVAQDARANDDNEDAGCAVS